MPTGIFRIADHDPCPQSDMQRPWLMLERFPGGLNRGYFHAGANMIQASCWDCLLYTSSQVLSAALSVDSNRLTAWLPTPTGTLSYWFILRWRGSLLDAFFTIPNAPLNRIRHANCCRGATLRSSAFDNVLVGRDAAAARYRLAGNRNRASVFEMNDLVHR